MEYKGFKINITESNDKEYPYIAVCQIGRETVKKRGLSKEQAIGLMESVIDFTVEINKK